MVVPKVKFCILEENKYLNLKKEKEKKENKRHGEKKKIKLQMHEEQKCNTSKTLLFDVLTVNIWGQFLRFSHKNGINNSSVH